VEELYVRHQMGFPRVPKDLGEAMHGVEMIVVGEQENCFGILRPAKGGLSNSVCVHRGLGMESGGKQLTQA
jgi:hypothetical protein